MPAVFAAFGRFLYRLLVGFLMATIITSIFAALVLGVTFGILGDRDYPRETLLGLAGGCGFMGSQLGGFAGGVMAALFAVRGSSAKTRRIGWWAVLGSVLGLLFGAAVAAGAGIMSAGIFGIEESRKTQSFMFLILGAGLSAGLLAGIIAALCSILQRGPDRSSR